MPMKPELEMMLQARASKPKVPRTETTGPMPMRYTDPMPPAGGSYSKPMPRADVMPPADQARPPMRPPMGQPGRPPMRPGMRTDVAEFLRRRRMRGPVGP